jgi:ATPase subunit of ABC transporter with duplicated ATPase domains
MAPKARATKSKSRMERYEQLLAQQYDEREDAAEFQIPSGPPLGDIVVRAENVSKAFGDRLLFENLTFNLPRGGIVGVIGPNGAGKTTLFKMIIGQEKPDEGKLRVGETVMLSYVDQSRDALNPKKTVYEEISGGLDVIEVGKTRIHARSYVGKFNFKGPDQQKFVGELSGGERNRVHLAKMLRTGGNLLLLDEPTNDLDVETLRSLEEGLQDFGGCAVVISHDRWFLDRIATHILAFEGDSSVYWFEGNYQMYEAERKRRLGVDADQPHRVRYKPMKR